MVNKNFWKMMSAVMVAVLSIGFASCSSDDDDNSSSSGTEGGLVSSTAPKKKGWDGSLQSGTATYCNFIASASDIASGNYQSYYAFSFSNSICQNAVFNVILPSEDVAKQYQEVFNNGTWASLDFGEEEYDYEVVARKMVPALRSEKFTNVIRRADSNINISDLGLNVKRDGKVLYIVVNCLKNKSTADVQSLVNRWNAYSNEVPNRVICGTYSETNGNYVFGDVFGLGIKYEISNTIENNAVKASNITMTFPNSTWATILYETFIDEDEDAYADVKINGKVVTASVAHPEALTLNDLKTIAAVTDWSYSVPFFCLMSGE